MDSNMAEKGRGGRGGRVQGPPGVLCRVPGNGTVGAVCGDAPITRRCGPGVAKASAMQVAALYPGVKLGCAC